MMPSRTLLDTDVVWAYIRGEPAIVSRIEDYINTHGKLNFSVFTYYAILKTLKAKEATNRLRAFNRICAASNIFEVTDGIVEQASDVYVKLYKSGEVIDDATTLIAATALVHGMVVATNDEERFSRIVGLQVENWLHS